VGLKGVLDALRDTWTIDVVTATENAYAPPGVTTHHVPPRSLKGLHRTLGRVRLGKLADLVTWPDPYWPWIWPALRTSTRIVEAQRPDAVLAFSMPFSSAILGTLLKARTGLPLVLNFNDSPTCSDMYPVYPSRLHYELSRWLEDQFARRADRVVYVSKTNRDRVAARQPQPVRRTVKLVRCSAIPPEEEASPPPPPAPFRIVYTGAMSAWHALDPTPPSRAKRAFQAWKQFGTYTHAPLDVRSHSPIFLGAAVQSVLDDHPEWKDKIHVDIYGNTYPDALVQRVLDAHNLTDIVRVHGRVAPTEVAALTQSAHLLFLTLPDRPDGTPGGRISLKTYEYLMTDRPILAAVPPGENWDFLQTQPGTFLSSPTDVATMAQTIEALVGDYRAGTRHVVNREALRPLFSARTRAESLSQLLREVIHEHAAPSPDGAPYSHLNRSRS
jgi:glycosyltransferase involved in cell wall biosynthesis